jgi:H+/Cl- antiporter ClcA
VLGASLLVGAAGGLASLVYLALLSAAKLVLWPGRTSAPVHWILLIAIGAVISVLLGVLGDPGETGVLVNSIHLDGGPSTLRRLRSLVPVSLLGIAVGGGIGPEPPLMQTTATISAWIGRRLRAPPAELRVLTVTGLASGLAVLFGAPLGAAIFALEILHRKGLEYYEALLPACAGSLASYAVYAALTGRGLTPAWEFPGAPHDLSLLDLILGVAGGVAGAAVAHLFGFMIKTCTRITARLPPWARPIAAGLALGALGLALPSGLTYGDAQLGALVAVPAVAVLSLLLAAAGHLVSAAIPLSCRWQGGVIIPMFLTGYCLGRALAEWSGHDGYVLVLATSMMVACNTGMTKTPLGSALVVSEMTAVTLVPPLVIAALVSLYLTSRVSFVGQQRHREQPEPRDAAPSQLRRRFVQPEADLHRDLDVVHLVVLDVPADAGDLEPVEVTQGQGRPADRALDRVVQPDRRGPDDLGDRVNVVRHRYPFRLAHAWLYPMRLCHHSSSATEPQPPLSCGQPSNYGAGKSLRISLPQDSGLANVSAHAPRPPDRRSRARLRLRAGPSRLRPDGRHVRARPSDPGHQRHDPGHQRHDPGRPGNSSDQRRRPRDPACTLPAGVVAPGSLHARPLPVGSHRAQGHPRGSRSRPRHPGQLHVAGGRPGRRRGRGDRVFLRTAAGDHRDDGHG